MTAYFIRRLFLVIPTLIGITVMVFAITRLVPGGPIERMILEARQMQVRAGGTGLRSEPTAAAVFQRIRSPNCGLITDLTSRCWSAMPTGWERSCEATWAPPPAIMTRSGK